MDQNISTDILIIGAGFCGKAVAHSINNSKTYIIIDKGEPLRLENVSRASVASYKPPLESKNCSFCGMGIMDANWQSYVMGGNSNWWGGWASRISKETFEKRGVLEWYLTEKDLQLFYEKAEDLLNVHGDFQIKPSLVGDIPGAFFWRKLTSFFGKTHVTSQSKNFTRDSVNKCMGRGICRNCPENAKTIPMHIKTEDVGHSTSLKQIKFSGNKAVSAILTDSEGELEIMFNEIVIAAGGYENVKILNNMHVKCGNYFQDHCNASLLVKLPIQVPYKKIGAEANVILDDLILNHNGIEVKPILLVTEPPVDFLNTSRIEVTDTNREYFCVVWLQIEIPPEWNLQMKIKGDNFYVDYTSYMKKLHLIDEAVEKISKKITSLGLEVCSEFLQYRYHFGGFHLSGTTSMGHVVDNDCRVIGTENVYVAGASVIPRAGSTGPTLTAVALSIRLGEFLLTKI